MFMRQIFIIISSAFICLATVSAQQTAPTDSLYLLNDSAITLAHFYGKKLVLVNIAGTKSSESEAMLRQMDSTYLLHKDSIALLAIPAYEAGYADSAIQRFKTWINDSLQLHFWVSKALYCFDSSGTLQHPLYKWLTTSAGNGHFDIPVTEIGQKFLINENGELKAAFSSQTLFSPILCRRILGYDE
jgi:glutathione peroxidase